MRAFVLSLVLLATFLWMKTERAAVDAPDRADTVVMLMAETGPGVVLILPQAIPVDAVVVGQPLVVRDADGRIAVAHQCHQTCTQEDRNAAVRMLTPKRAFPLLCFHSPQAASDELTGNSTGANAHVQSAFG